MSAVVMEEVVQTGGVSGPQSLRCCRFNDIGNTVFRLLPRCQNSNSLVISFSHILTDFIFKGTFCDSVYSNINVAQHLFHLNRNLEAAMSYIFQKAMISELVSVLLRLHTAYIFFYLVFSIYHLVQAFCRLSSFLFLRCFISKIDDSYVL